MDQNCHEKQNFFFNFKNVIMSKSSSKNLSNANKHIPENWHFYTLFIWKTTTSEILWRIFWRDNCRLIIGAIENFRFWVFPTTSCILEIEILCIRPNLKKHFNDLRPGLCLRVCYGLVHWHHGKGMRLQYDLKCTVHCSVAFSKF